MRNVLFIGHFLPNGRNVYETNLITELKKQIDDIEVITINKGYTELETTFLGIPVHAVKAIKKPIIDEIIRFFDTMRLLRNWEKRYGHNDSRIILLNASIEVNLAVLLVSKLCKIKVSGLLIDTALGNFKRNTIWNRYLYFCYYFSEKIYKYLDGNMALNPRVVGYLNLTKKPFHLTKIGYSGIHKYSTAIKQNKKKKIVYTGSLMYYDGTEELLNAVAQLEQDNIELLIFGSGPLSQMAKSFAAKYNHIKFMGYLPNDKISQVLHEADFLINPRIAYFYTDIFGFPSKIIEYLLSGTPVITTPFAAMPEAYEEFVYLIQEESVKGIKNAIITALHDKPEVWAHKTRKAYQYVIANNQYTDIVREMLEFVFSL